jgi:uncharacterized membrane protein
MNVLEPWTLSMLAIAVMAIATVLMRGVGFWLMAHVPPTARVRRMLEALPGSIVAAIVLPIVAKSGPVAVLAIVTAAAAMILRRNAFLAVAAGMMAAALARSVGI